MGDFDFITDATLRKTIEDSIEFAFTLREEAKGADKSSLYMQEINRVTILYVVAVIEAVLLHLYKKSGKVMNCVEYAYAEQLGTSYRHSSDQGSPVVVAVKKIGAKADFQIGMNDLIRFFQEQKLIKKGMAAGLARINDLRNTFHLSKSRRKNSCSIAKVESAFKLLLDVIKVARQAILKA